MKKTLIAIAALAATGAFAQSSVTIDGTIDAGVTVMELKGAKVAGVNTGISATNGFAFKGVSDLGGGMKMGFKLGTDFNPVSSTANQGMTGQAATGAATVSSKNTFGNSETFVNVEGGFGNLQFGAINNMGLVAHGTATPFATAIGSGYRATSSSAGNAGGSAAARNDNTFAYTTPVMMGGLSATWLARKQQTSGSQANTFVPQSAGLGAEFQSQISEVALRYSAGPLNAILSRSMEDATNVLNTALSNGATGTAGNKGVLNAIAANYSMGAMTIYGGWQGQKSNNIAGLAQRDTTAINLAVKYVAGTNTFLAGYGRLTGATASTKIDAATGLTYGINGTTGVQNATGATTLLGLGYEYALSKSAAFVVRYERLADNRNTNVVDPTGYNAALGADGTAANQDRTRTGVGFRMAF